ncbi:unnamed protein product [Polarella glacialis]|uniref:Uncharacterized protein n=1 Tax=Polarella glacialis TaxID=89957 RepID=A0A813GW83_POLGL|nr:unnamed protein product [Polarella glacialis]
MVVGHFLIKIGCLNMFKQLLCPTLISGGGSTAPQHFGSVPPEICSTQYVNHEGVPELVAEDDAARLEENRFEAVSLFRRNPRCLAEDKGGLGSSAEVFAWQLRLQEKLAQTSAAAKPGGVQQAVDFWLQRSKAVLGRQQYFLAYEHGKAAVRLGSGARPDGLHSFGAPPATAAGSASPEEPASVGCWCPEEAAVLHYAHGGFQAVAEKLRRLCASKGSWWRCYALYTQGRHLSDQDLSSIYRGAVALCDDEAEAARQIASGVCLRYHVADCHLPRFDLHLMD